MPNRDYRSPKYGFLFETNANTGKHFSLLFRNTSNVVMGIAQEKKLGQPEKSDWGTLAMRASACFGIFTLYWWVF